MQKKLTTSFESLFDYNWYDIDWIIVENSQNKTPLPIWSRTLHSYLLG